MGLRYLMTSSKTCSHEKSNISNGPFYDFINFLILFYTAPLFLENLISVYYLKKKRIYFLKLTYIIKNKNGGKLDAKSKFFRRFRLTRSKSRQAADQKDQDHPRIRRSNSLTQLPEPKYSVQVRRVYF